MARCRGMAAAAAGISLPGGRLAATLVPVRSSGRRHFRVEPNCKAGLIPVTRPERNPATGRLEPDPFSRRLKFTGTHLARWVNRSTPPLAAVAKDRLTPAPGRARAGLLARRRKEAIRTWAAGPRIFRRPLRRRHPRPSQGRRDAGIRATGNGRRRRTRRCGRVCQRQMGQIPRPDGAVGGGGWGAATHSSSARAHGLPPGNTEARQRPSQAAPETAPESDRSNRPEGASASAPAPNRCGETAGRQRPRSSPAATLTQPGNALEKLALPLFISIP